MSADVLAKVQAVIADKLEVDASKITPEANFTHDLGADSLDVVELVMALEEEFDVEIPDEEAEKLQTVQNDASLNSEDKIAAVQKELEEATSLELPMLSKNLSIITTCATIATLWGLIGTVLGMIRSFAAMSAAGSPDTAALATGISEALINTAIGIIGSVVGIIMYNYFSSRVDAITHSMDEAGYSLLHTLKTSK